MAIDGADGSGTRGRPRAAAEPAAGPAAEAEAGGARPLVGAEMVSDCAVTAPVLFAVPVARAH